MSQEDIRIVPKMRIISPKNNKNNVANWRDMTPRNEGEEMVEVRPPIPKTSINTLPIEPPSADKWDVFINKKTKEQMVLILESPTSSVVLLGHLIELSRGNMTVTYSLPKTKFYKEYVRKA